MFSLFVCQEEPEEEDIKLLRKVVRETLCFRIKTAPTLIDALVQSLRPFGVRRNPIVR